MCWIVAAFRAEVFTVFKVTGIEKRFTFGNWTLKIDTRVRFLKTSPPLVLNDLLDFPGGPFRVLVYLFETTRLSALLLKADRVALNYNSEQDARQTEIFEVNEG